ncbi:MAG: PEGA domain-containing protein [Planctomycetes bacterium]|nr:PEGA domain-containing protein [Planctomycetota bacterium]
MRVVAFILCAALAGCAAQRELTIDSTPPGALVRLDDMVVGVTPFKTSFEAYGTRRVTLYLEGYRSQSRLVEIKPPWYAHFPLDVISEVLLPFGWRDRHEVALVLVAEDSALSMPDIDPVLQRAESLRLAEPTGPRPLPAKAHEEPR